MSGRYATCKVADGAGELDRSWEGVDPLVSEEDSWCDISETAVLRGFGVGNGELGFVTLA